LNFKQETVQLVPVAAPEPPKPKPKPKPKPVEKNAESSDEEPVQRRKSSRKSGIAPEYGQIEDDDEGVITTIVRFGGGRQSNPGVREINGRIYDSVSRYEMAV
jgi:hypothetical protein